jgi:hypothetical protein
MMWPERSLRAARVAIAAALVLAPAIALAGTPHALAVTLRDVTGVGVVGALVTVHARSGQALANGQNDRAGAVRFEALAADAVLVAVAGELPGGVPLVQRGMDSHGIPLTLDGPEVRLRLLVEPGGAVVPDPADFSSDAAPTEPGLPGSAGGALSPVIADGVDPVHPVPPHQLGLPVRLALAIATATSAAVAALYAWRYRR